MYTYFLYKLKKEDNGKLVTPPVDDNRVNLGLFVYKDYYLGRLLDNTYIKEINDFSPLIIENVVADRLLSLSKSLDVTPRLNLLEKIIFKIFRCICDNENINSFDLKKEFYVELMKFEELQKKESENGLLYDVAIQKLDGQLLTVEGKK